MCLFIYKNTLEGSNNWISQASLSLVSFSFQQKKKDGDRPVEEAKKLKCYKRLTYSEALAREARAAEHHG